MKTISKFLILFMALAISSPVVAQKSNISKHYKTQYQLGTKILSELRQNHGAKSIAQLRKVETKKAFVAYLKKKSIKCKKCPAILEFSEGLAVVNEDFVDKGKLTYGDHLINTLQNEEGTDPDPDTDSDDDDDKDTDGPGETESPEGGSGCPPCGPFNCLSHWGSHIPCCDMP